MYIEKINLYQFMIFKQAGFTFNPRMNLIIGKNESGKSVLSVDALRYIFLKKYRYKKLNDLIYCHGNFDEGAFASCVCRYDEKSVEFCRFVSHPKYKCNVIAKIVDENNEKNIFDFVDFEDIGHLKNNNIKAFVELISHDLLYFDYIYVFHPVKNILSEKNILLDILSLNMNNIVSFFGTIVTFFDNYINNLKTDIDSIEHRIKILIEDPKYSPEYIQKMKARLIEIDQEIKNMDIKKKKGESVRLKLKGNIEKIQENIHHLSLELDKYKKFKKDGICFTCGRPFDQFAKIQEKIDSIENEMNKNLALLYKIKNDYKIVNEKLYILETGIKKLIKESQNFSVKEVAVVSELNTLNKLLEDKKSYFYEIYNQFIEFLNIYKKIFDTKQINDFIKHKMKQFEELYEYIYGIMTDEYIKIDLNLNKYDEPVFDGLLYSGLSTSKKRIITLCLMLSIHYFCNFNFKTIILDEFFDVFDEQRMTKVLDGIMNVGLFDKLQFIVTSNNENIIEYIKSIFQSDVNIINLLD